MTKHLFWITSYPKSGNTLLRAIISSLFFSDSGLFDFKMLNNIPVIEDTKNLDFIKNKFPKDYENINQLNVLSKYWVDIQTKKNFICFCDCDCLVATNLKVLMAKMHV